jgi:hypothetical protein
MTTSEVRRMREMAEAGMMAPAIAREGVAVGEPFTTGPGKPRSATAILIVPIIWAFRGGGPGIYVFINDSQSGFIPAPDDNVIGTVTATPIPAALPLFATVLGGLGLLGWRRKAEGIGGRRYRGEAEVTRTSGLSRHGRNRDPEPLPQSNEPGYNSVFRTFHGGNNVEISCVGRCISFFVRGDSHLCCAIVRKFLRAN